MQSEGMRETEKERMTSHFLVLCLDRRRVSMYISFIVGARNPTDSFSPFISLSLHSC